MFPFGQPIEEIDLHAMDTLAEDWPGACSSYEAHEVFGFHCKKCGHKVEDHAYLWDQKSMVIVPIPKTKERGPSTRWILIWILSCELGRMFGSLIN